MDYATRVAALAELQAMVKAAELRPLQRVVGQTAGRSAPAVPVLAPIVRDLLADWTNGQIKLYLIQRVLAERRAHPDAFTTGTYIPLQLEGPGKDHVVGFLRGDGAMEYLSLAPRLAVALTKSAQTLPLGTDTWGDTTAVIPGGVADAVYENVLTGETVVAREADGRVAISLAEAFATSPVAFLRRSVV